MKNVFNAIFLILSICSPLWGVDFLDAIRRNDYYLAKEILADAANSAVIARSKTFDRLLMGDLLLEDKSDHQRKIATPDPRLLRLLINYGIDCSEGAFYDKLAIVPEIQYAGIAPYQDNPSLVKTYLLAGVNAKALLAVQQLWHNDPFTLAAINGDYDTVQSIINDKIQKAHATKTSLQHFIDTKDELQLTPLIYAATQGHLDVVTLLLAHDADPLAQTIWGHTVFDLILEHLLNPNLDKVAQENLIKIYTQCDYFLAKKRTGLFNGRPDTSWRELLDPENVKLVLPKDVLNYLHSFLIPVPAHMLSNFIAHTTKPAPLPTCRNSLVEPGNFHDLNLISGVPTPVQHPTDHHAALFAKQQKTKKFNKLVVKPALMALGLTVVGWMIYERIAFIYNMGQLAYATVVSFASFISYHQHYNKLKQNLENPQVIEQLIKDPSSLQALSPQAKDVIIKILLELKENIVQQPDESPEATQQLANLDTVLQILAQPAT